MTMLLSFVFKILFTFRERGREQDRVGEKHQCVVASWAPCPGDLAHNPSMCSDWESNQQIFGSQASAQSTEPHQPGPTSYCFIFRWVGCLSVRPYIHASVHPCIHLPVCPSVHPSICLSIHPSIHPSSICPFIYPPN